MDDKQDVPTARAKWTVAGIGAARAAFGMVWAVDAYLAWRPEFAAHYVGYLQNASQRQPAFLHGWFAMWLSTVTTHAAGFVLVTRLIETAIAIGLLAGLARRWTYVVGALFSLLLWSTAEGFSGPYVAGAANLGPALIYVLVFVVLWLCDRVEGRTPYSVDFYLGRRWPRWQRVAESASPEVLARVPPELPWSEQGGAIAAIVVAMALLAGGLQSALNVPPATPMNAAAAVSPLSLVSSTHEAHARDAHLPPLAGTGDDVSIALEATDATVKIANGVNYLAWTFGATVPAPVLHVRQGQTVHVTFTNHGMMQHSIDFHAAQVAPDVAYRSVDPGQSVDLSFVALVPGAFIYHCGTPPVLLHMGNGMYGALIVDPVKPLPPADQSYVLVQGEWYTQQIEGRLMAGDFGKMMTGMPDEVVFNGMAFQYKDHPLAAKVGKRVRLYVIDAGPNLSSAFHVIGGIFETVYPDGDAAHALSGVSTYPLAPGEGAVFDIELAEAGKYPFVDHSMRDMEIGAVGLLEATP
jgi:nitrite reductase (NO-forming)